MTISIDLIKQLRDKTLAPLGDCKEALVEAQGDIDQAQEILKKKGAIKADKKADRETNAWVVKFIATTEGLVGVKLLCETDFVSKNDAFQWLVQQIIDLVAAQSGEFVLESAPETLIDAISNILKDNAVMIGENMRLAYIIKKKGQVVPYNHMGNTLASAVFYTGEGDAIAAFAKDCALQVAAMSPLYISFTDVDSDRIAKLKADFVEEMASANKPADIVEKIIEGKIQKALQEDVLLEQASIKDATKKMKELMPQWCTLVDIIRVGI